MFDKLVNWITGRLADARPIVETVNEQPYAVKADGTLGEAIRPLAPITKPTLAVATLTGFVAAVKAQIDSFDGKVAVHVVDYNTVRLVSLEADTFGKRHVWLEAKNQEQPPFAFDSYQQPEKFLLALPAGFLPTDNVIAIQRVVSGLSSESSVSLQDDGLSQTITVKQGAVAHQSVDLPARIPLFAYRTFREVDPVQSEFMLRLKGETGELPLVALLQIDAGKWKHDTALQVKSYLEKLLPEGTIVIA